MQCYLGKACEGHQVEPWKQSVHAPSESSKTVLICFSKRWPPRDRNSDSRCGQYGKVRLASEQTAVHVPVLRRLAATLMRDDELGTSGTGLTAWENRVSKVYIIIFLPPFPSLSLSLVCYSMSFLFLSFLTSIKMKNSFITSVVHGY